MSRLNPDLLREGLVATYGKTPDAVRIDDLPGHASSRTYARVHVADGSPATTMWMLLPEDAAETDEGTNGPAATTLPFLDVQRFLHGAGVRVPEIHAELLPRALVTEDLGDETFEARLLAQPENIEALYFAAVDFLVDAQSKTQRVPSSCIASQREFDAKLLRWELDHFVEFFVEPFDSENTDWRSRFAPHFGQLVAEILAQPQAFVMRDFQSRNLMWKRGELVVIDFQDALIGPRIYDLVALLCDSYVELTLELQTACLQRYAELTEQDVMATQTAFWHVALQRKMKDSGRFVFIDRVRGNPDFLRHIPQSVLYIARAAQQLGHSELLKLLGAACPAYSSVFDHSA